LTAATNDARVTPKMAWPSGYPCPSWCTYGDRHGGQDLPDDRNHFGVSYEISLTLEKNLKMSDDEWKPAFYEVYLRQHQLQTEAIIEISKNEETCVKLTLDEARGLAFALLDSATAAES
jgi:hypothetical protein